MMNLHQMGAGAGLQAALHPRLSPLCPASGWPGRRIATDWSINLRTFRSVCMYTNRSIAAAVRKFSWNQINQYFREYVSVQLTKMD